MSGTQDCFAAEKAGALCIGLTGLKLPPQKACPAYAPGLGDDAFCLLDGAAQAAERLHEVRTRAYTRAVLAPESKLVVKLTQRSRFRKR